MELLSATQIKEYNDKGFLVLPGFASEEECQAVKDRANQIVEEFNPAEFSVFSTTNQEKLTSEYFLKSSSNTSCFFEEGAFDPDGKLLRPKAISINKIGHALHDVDPVFREFSRSAKMQALYRSLGFQKPLPVQSMYIFKQPSIGGPVVPHQDSAFLATEPLSCVGVWLAVEDATLQNGCLFAASASHRNGVRGRMTLDASRTGVTWGDSKPDFSDSTLEPLEVATGTLVVLHGSNVHGSNANTSDTSRHAYSMHCVEGEGTEWLPDNWLHRSADLPFEPLYT